MENNTRYHRDNRNAAFALGTLFVSISALIWFSFPDHTETHLKYLSAIGPMVLGLYGVGGYQHWKMKKTRKR